MLRLQRLSVTVLGFEEGSNTCSAGARVLIFAQPGHSSEFFEDLNSEVRNLPDDLQKVPEIGLRHQIEMMPDGAEAR